MFHSSAFKMASNITPDEDKPMHPAGLDMTRGSLQGILDRDEVNVSTTLPTVPLDATNPFINPNQTLADIIPGQNLGLLSSLKITDADLIIRNLSNELNAEVEKNDQSTTLLQRMDLYKESADQEPRKFGPRPDTSNADFDFKMELDRLPFTINIGEAPLSREQQSCFIDLIYDYKEVFSLYDGDLGFCDTLKHSIPTTTDKPIYLPHRQIPVQLQQEVRKCLESWLKQGIIRLSKSPYASQVVIVCKKSGKI